jgi:hypothetical protein
MTKRLVPIAVLLFAGCGRDVAKVIVGHAHMVAPSPQLARDVRQLAGSGMNRSVVFNRLPSEGEVAVILADPRTNWDALAHHDAAVRNVKENCYTSARARTVVCDASVFTKRPDAMVGGAANEAQRTAFARWILGHELGHIATATAGYHSDPLADVRRARDLQQQRREYAADCWVVQTLGRSFQRSDQIALEQFAMDTLNEHFRRSEPNRPAGVGLIFDYRSLNPYDFIAGGSHPDTNLRSIRLLHIASEQRGDVGLRQMISPLVRRLVPDSLWTGRGPCGLS